MAHLDHAFYSTVVVLMTTKTMLVLQWVVWYYCYYYFDYDDDRYLWISKNKYQIFPILTSDKILSLQYRKNRIFFSAKSNRKKTNFFFPLRFFCQLRIIGWRTHVYNMHWISSRCSCPFLFFFFCTRSFFFFSHVLCVHMHTRNT